MPNLMFEHLTILEILTIDAQKMGSRDPDPTPFTRIFLWGHVGTLPGSMHAKFLSVLAKPSLSQSKSCEQDPLTDTLKQFLQELFPYITDYV